MIHNSRSLCPAVNSLSRVTTRTSSFLSAKRSSALLLPFKAAVMVDSRSYFKMSTAHPSSSPLLASTQITLTQKESQLRDLLLDVSRYIDESKEIKEHLELRFAGGWVRDKLLNIPSNDIDTAINAMTGQDFCHKMTEYLEDPANMNKHRISKEDVGNMHKISANPEKSKHLETVTTQMLGFDLDFVNLRKETYTADSRNPQMEFGTAREDALRRDATINALFYNIQRNTVEDFAGGLADLKANRIRTPLEPHQTFLDDPLRVLRLIRFASRLGFKIDEESEVSMSDPSIKSALKLKISRERVGTELEKMLKEKDPNKPRRALQLIDERGLYSTIFTDPTAKDLPGPKTDQWRKAYDCLHLMVTSDSIYKILVYKDFVTPDDTGHRHEDAPLLTWILSALSPWAQISLPPRKASGKLSLPYGAAVAREGIKSPIRVVNIVAGAFRNFEEITELKIAINNRKSWVLERDTLGMAIRRWDKDGGYWRLQILFAILVEAMQLSPDSGYTELFSEWQIFLDHLQQMDLLNAESMLPIVDGNDLQSELGATPGKWMAPALAFCLEWQFRNPEATDKKEAIEEIRKRSGELKITFKKPSIRK